MEFTRVRLTSTRAKRQAVVTVACEALEQRRYLSVVTGGIPNYVQQGPSPISNVVGIPDQGGVVAGAISVLATDPSIANTIYAASVNGGIWKTVNGNWPNDGIDNNHDGAVDDGRENPTWQPMTDQYGSNQTDDIQFDPTDPTHQTLWAAIGISSSLNADNSPLLGLLKTTDGGATWTHKGQLTLRGTSIRRVLPTSLFTPNGQQVVLAAGTNSGIWISTDGGDSFQLASGTGGLPAGPGVDLAADGAGNYFAAVAGEGVFTFHLAGTTFPSLPVAWFNTRLPSAGSSFIHLSVRDPSTTGAHPLFAAIIGGAGTLRGVYRYVGVTWTQILNAPAIHGIPSGYNHTGLLADPTNANRVYITGSIPTNIWLGNATTNSWTALGTNGTTPHSDVRFLGADANGNVLEASDGGVYRLFNPNSIPNNPTAANSHPRRWFDLNGNIDDFEAVSVGYDRFNDVFTAGVWDNGDAVQDAPGSSKWTETDGGDGSTQLVDNNPTGADLPASTVSVRYSLISGSSLVPTINFIHRRSFGVSNNLLEDIVLPLTGVSSADRTQFGSNLFLSALDGRRLFAQGGAGSLYESTNRGSTVTNVAGRFSRTLGSAWDVAAGGTAGGVASPDQAYVADDTGLFLRAPGATSFQLLGSYPGHAPRKIAVDPANWHTVYVLDYFDAAQKVSHIFKGTNVGQAGTVWTDITSNLNTYLTSYFMAGYFQADFFRTITLAKVGATSVLLAGGQGGVYRLINPGPATSQWTRFGTLPAAEVSSLQYYPAATVRGRHVGDVLAVGTLGRGVFAVRNASLNLALSTNVTVTGNVGTHNDVVRVVRDGIRLNIFVNNTTATPTFSADYGSLAGVTISLGAGTDTFIADFANGIIVPAGGMSFDGGGGDSGAGDTLQVVGSDEPDGIQARAGLVDFRGSSLFPGNGTLGYLRIHTLQINSGGGNDYVVIAGGNPSTVTSVNAGADDDVISISDSPFGNLDNLPARVSVVGAGGNDFIEVHDEANTRNDNFTISSQQITRDHWSGMLRYSAENLRILAGSGDNVFSIAPDIGIVQPTYIIDGGDGTNQTTYLPPSFILSTLMVTRVQRALIDYRGIKVPPGDPIGPWELNGTSLSLNKSLLFSLGSVNTFTIDLPNGPNTFNIESATKGVSYSINGGTSDDTLKVFKAAAGSKVTLSGGGGTNQFVLGDSSLSGLLGSLTVSGKGGKGTLTLNDQATAANVDGDWQINSGLIARTAFGGVALSDLVAVVIKGGMGSTKYNITATPAAAALAIDTGSGTDAVTISNNGSLAGWQGPITLTGAGKNSLILNDAQDASPGAFLLGWGSAQFTAANSKQPALVTFKGFSSETVLGGTVANTFDVVASLAMMSTTIFAGDGKNTITVGDGPNNLISDVAGPLFLNGGKGSTSLHLFDLNDKADVNWAISDSQISHDKILPAISISQVQSLDLHAGLGNDWIFVNTTQKGTQVSADGGSGNDYMSGGDGNDSFFGGQGDDILIGGLGSDLLEGNTGANVFQAEDGQADTVITDSVDDRFNLDKIDTLINQQPPPK